MRLGRKGTAAKIIMESWDIVRAGVMILIFIALILIVYNKFLSTSDQGTRESFRGLVFQVKAVLEDGETRVVPMFIKGNWGPGGGLNLLAFNRGEPEFSYNANVFGAPDTTQKPLKCGSDACLCICDEMSCSSGLQDCETFSGVFYFAGWRGDFNEGAPITGLPGRNHVALFGQFTGKPHFDKGTIQISRQADAQGNTNIYFDRAK